MKIGVVLCTYNGERYLPEQLDSIFAQERLPDEMLVQDDGSADHTLEILAGYSAKAPFPIEVVRNPQNLGFVRNFESAMARCNAEIIATCDQDDSWRFDKLKKLEQIFDAHRHVSVAFSDAEMVDEHLRPLGYGLFQVLNVSPVDRDRISRQDFLPVVLRRNIVPGATMALRAASRNRVLPIAEGAYHDEWMVLIAAAYNELAFCAEPLVRHRQHAANRLGMRPEGFLDRIRKALHPQRREEDLRRLKVLEQLHERLRALGCRPEVLAEVRAKADHLRVRNSLPSTRIRRIGPIVREVASGRYSKYSSWRGAVRDLLGPRW